MTTTATRRQLRTVSALRPGRDPGGRLAVLLAALTTAGLPIAKGAATAAAEAARLAGEAGSAGKNIELSRAERQYAADRLRHQAARARTDALAALDGKRIEEAGRKTVTEAAGRIASALAELPEHIASAEQAVAAGPGIAAGWAGIAADDRRAAETWAALDQARALGVLPGGFTRHDLSPAASDLGLVLATPGSHEGGAYYCPAAHRCAEPWAITGSTSASAMLRRGLTPDVLSADQARANVAAYAASTLAEARSGARP